MSWKSEPSSIIISLAKAKASKLQLQSFMHHDLQLKALLYKSHAASKYRLSKAIKFYATMAVTALSMTGALLLWLSLFTLITYSHAQTQNAGDSTNNWAVLVCTSRYWYVPMSLKVIILTVTSFVEL